jgi:hypothetical protein
MMITMAPRTVTLFKVSLVPFTLLLSLMGGSRAVRADDGLITQFCMAAFNAAMSSARETPPAGMGAYTCNCFLNEVKSGAAIDAAQESCKTKAAARYKL